MNLNSLEHPRYDLAEERLDVRWLRWNGSGPVRSVDITEASAIPSGISEKLNNGLSLENWTVANHRRAAAKGFHDREDVRGKVNRGGRITYTRENVPACIHPDGHHWVKNGRHATTGLLREICLRMFRGEKCGRSITSASGF